MSEESFDKLLSYIRHDLVENEMMANPRGGAIIPEIRLFCTLRRLAGGSYLDICDITGILRGLVLKSFVENNQSNCVLQTHGSTFSRCKRRM